MYQDEDKDISLFNIELVCTECNWEGMGQDVDKVPDPRGDGVWRVCPSCRTPEHLDLVREEPN
jgi:hypothetical protein